MIFAVFARLMARPENTEGILIVFLKMPTME